MLNRRRFLLSSAAMIAAGAAPRVIRPAIADAAPTTLRVESRTIEVQGKAAKVFGIRQPDGTQGLTTDVSAPFRVRLENQTPEPTLIHWHGLKPPYGQDGVPEVSAPLIAPGDAAEYDFPLAFPGTFWMHSHQGLQEQRLMAAPLIVRDGARVEGQEIVVMLHDFAFASPEEILAGLRKGSSQGAMQMGGAVASGSMQGMAMPGSMGHDMAAMKHDGMRVRTRAAMRNAEASSMTMDLNDVAYDAFLANDRTLADPEVVRVESNAPVLLRIINGAAASNFVIDLDRLKGELVAVDGHPIQPVAGSRFPIGTAQRLDLRLQIPRERAVHPVFAMLEGERKRTGIVLATAGARIARFGESAEKPARALNFAFERSLKAEEPLSAKPADRVHHLDLTGSMNSYDWGLNGAAYPDAMPLTVARGERVEIEMANMTMMAHPMHLHGHFFQVVAVDGKRFSGAVRDTVLVPPMMTVTIAFDADNPGQWVFHCHNLYHMASGMMATLRYDSV
jgi:FtsP/CotA-like multicopper oxidase with cupredoxin domain